MSAGTLGQANDGLDEITSPILRRLYEDWEQRRGGRGFPARSDFDPIDLKYILGSLSLIEVAYAPLRFRFRLHASDNALRLDADLTGRSIDGHPVEESRKLMRAQCEAVVTKRRAMARVRTSRLGPARLWRYQVLMLPLSSDGTIIDMIMSGMVWNGF